MPINPSVGPSNRQPVCPSVSQPVSQSVSQSINPSVSLLTSPTIQSVLNPSDYQTRRQSHSQSVNPSISPLNSINQADGQSVSRTTPPLTSAPTSPAATTPVKQTRSRPPTTAAGRYRHGAIPAPQAAPPNEAWGCPSLSLACFLHPDSHLSLDSFPFCHPPQ